MDLTELENRFRKELKFLIFPLQVTGFPNVFVFKKKEIIYGNGKRSQIPSKHLESDERVIWAEQPKELKRSKRYITEDMLFSDFDFLWNLIPNKNRKQPIFNDELWDQEWYMVS